jgi:hypothetical protein
MNRQTLRKSEAKFVAVQIPMRMAKCPSTIYRLWGAIRGTFGTPFVNGN